MLEPSSIQNSESSKLEVTQVRQGLYIIENAYEGVYEYFKDYPSIIDKSNLDNSSDDSGSEAGESRLEEWRKWLKTDVKAETTPTEDPNVDSEFGVHKES